LDRFAFSESDFYQVFSLNHSGDRKKINEYVPADLSAPLPPYHSYYHDVAENDTSKATVVMRPVPTGDKILEVFKQRFESMRPEKTKRSVLQVI
jgi:hypothetical protein